MPGDGHDSDQMPTISEDLSTSEALAVILGELRRQRGTIAEQSSTIELLAREVDRLRLRIRYPELEELSKADAASVLGVSRRTIENYARRWREGDRSGLQHHYRKGRGGKEFYTTQAYVEAFKRANRLLD